MHRLKLPVAVVALICLGAVFVLPAQDQLTIDATNQPSPPPRGRGPFPGSATPGHSPGLPVRLELVVPTGDLRSDRTTVIDFIITNIGTESIKLPFSIQQGNLLPTPPETEYKADVMTLWLTSDAIVDRYAKDVTSGRLFKVDIVGTSANLYGRSDNPESFCVLAPNKSLRVHAHLGVQLKPGNDSLTAHAELDRLSIRLNDNSPAHNTVDESAELLGTADSESVTEMIANSR